MGKKFLPQIFCVSALDRPASLAQLQRIRTMTGRSIAPPLLGFTRPTVGRSRQPVAQSKALNHPCQAMVAERPGTNGRAPPELYNYRCTSGNRRALPATPSENNII